ncbi:hypothetical protein [Variovorax saccharolyticus]|uniref:hypothetical protein n=1 Tax=Variovorax saccharolyticus TaxID=3053516 RepID=UPI002576AE07|nr:MULTISPECIES: hypothetical protein [unclassified Variovorax]MDM0022495.1 hypothetical protein [Variovorax sp. J22R187]MDM0028259.1 hypothetical protein [Variovorax sp. J31P216]
MTEDTAQKILRDARAEAIKTATRITVVGHRLSVLVRPHPPGSEPRADFLVHGIVVSLGAAAAAMAGSRSLHVAS